MKKVFIFYFLICFINCNGNEFKPLKNIENGLNGEKITQYCIEKLAGKYEGFLYDNNDHRVMKFQLQIFKNKVYLCHLVCVCELIVEKIDKPFTKIDNWYIYKNYNEYVFSKKKKKDTLMYCIDHESIDTEVFGEFSYNENSINLKINRILNNKLKNLFKEGEFIGINHNIKMNILKIRFSNNNFIEFKKISEKVNHKIFNQKTFVK